MVSKLVPYISAAKFGERTLLVCVAFCGDFAVTVLEFIGKVNNIGE